MIRTLFARPTLSGWPLIHTAWRSTSTVTTRIEQPAAFNQKNRRGGGGQNDNHERTTPYGWLMLSIPVATFGLGCWQVQRKQWKENLVRELETQTNKPAIPFPRE